MKYKELKHHPSYWILHKKYWQEEYDVLDKGIANEIMRNPKGPVAYELEKRVRTRLKEGLLLRPA